MLISTCWVSQLLTDWESPVWRHFLRDLGEFATVIRFDERGHGLSDWNVEDHSHEARLGDLAAVADDAGFERFALMAMAQGGPIAIDYAARNPERVTRLLFYDSYALGQRDTSPEALELSDALGQLVRAGWGRPESQGHSNEEIAAALVVSLRTVERHLQNVYGKLGVQGRAARTAAVARLLTSA